jgi:type I restriction-modification system DNA methylase subunit
VTSNRQVPQSALAILYVLATSRIKMRKSLGSKPKELRDADTKRICDLCESFRNEPGSDEHPAVSKVFKREEFGYATISARVVARRLSVCPADKEAYLRCGRDRSASL